jgi:hypothetical protein
MGLENRLARLEASMFTHNGDNGARERLEEKLTAVAESHRVARERGEELHLEGQSLASLVGLIGSYDYGEVPPEVAEATWTKVQEVGPVSRSAAFKLVRTCLKRKGCHHGF